MAARTVKMLILSFVLLISGLSQAAWKSTTVSRMSMAFPSIAVDPAGRPHIIYFNDSNPRNYVFRHAFFDGKAWRPETVDQGNVGGWSSIAVDSLGHLHISYHTDAPSSSR